MATLTQNHTTRSTGTVLTANLYNDDHDTHILNIQGLPELDQDMTTTSVVTFGGYDPEHATDGGTDAYASATNTSPPGDGVKIVRDFQSANTTTTPELDSKVITDRDGNALWSGAISGVHSLQYDGGADTYLLLYPQPIDEDDMASDSDAAVPTQQSVKAYVDSRERWAQKTSNQTVTSSSYEDVTDVGIAVGAGETWAFDIKAHFRAGSDTSVQFALNGPSASDIIILGTQVQDNDGVFIVEEVTAYDTVFANAATSPDVEGTAYATARITFTSSGTLQLRVRRDTGTGPATARRPTTLIGRRIA